MQRRVLGALAGLLLACVVLVLFLFPPGSGAPTDPEVPSGLAGPDADPTPAVRGAAPDPAAEPLAGVADRKTARAELGEL